MRRALVVIGKAPEPGRAKTRLVPPLSAEQAARLYRAFLLDAVQLGLDLAWERVCVIHPRGAAARLRRVLPVQVHLLEQPTTGLTDALAHAFERHFAEGFSHVVLIGSDNPTLRQAPIQEAVQSDEDVSLGPTLDGGYYLVGMRQPHLGIFHAIEWSTSRVYAQTLARARQLGLRVHAVQPWFDVDDPADLDRLRRELKGSPADVAPHTRLALQRLDGTSTEGVLLERSAYARANRAATAAPVAVRASSTTEPPKPPPVIRAP
jgi:rSAM/selenodomain-associated transferase 1